MCVCMYVYKANDRGYSITPASKVTVIHVVVPFSSHVSNTHTSSVYVGVDDNSLWACLPTHGNSRADIHMRIFCNRSSPSSTVKCPGDGRKDGNIGTVDSYIYGWQSYHRKIGSVEFSHLLRR